MLDNFNKSSDNTFMHNATDDHVLNNPNSTPAEINAYWYNSWLSDAKAYIDEGNLDAAAECIALAKEHK